MKGVFESLEHHNICHGDVRLHNICFRKDFSPVLIDFDFCVLKPNKERDLWIFGEELKNLYNERDQFITKLRFGFFNEELLASSVVCRRSTRRLSEVLSSPQKTVNYFRLSYQATGKHHSSFVNCICERIM